MKTLNIIIDYIINVRVLLKIKGTGTRLLYPVSKKRYTLSAGNGYVLSYSIRSADQKFKDYVLDEKEYIEKGNDFKIKSRLYPREITVTTTNTNTIYLKVLRAFFMLIYCKSQDIINDFT